MSFETYKQKMTDLNCCIRPGKSVSFSFDGSDVLGASRLFMTGETNISPLWKTEPDYAALYRRIDDSLRSDVANLDRFCLDMSGGRCKYPKIAFKKLVAPLRTPMFVLKALGDKWHFGASVKATDLKIYGYLRITLEVRYKKDGVDKHSTVPEPDAVFTIDVPEGSYDWRTLREEIVIDQANLANVCYFVEGEDYEGEVYVEAPEFAFERFNLVGQFLPHSEDRLTLNWMGQNLSRIEWVGWRIDINGQRVFDGEIFERCHRFSEAEITLPADVIHENENIITFTCTSNYRDAAAYILREWGFIKDRKSFIISAPHAVALGVPFYVCVEGKAGEEIEISSGPVTYLGEPTLSYDGLNALKFVCNTPANDISFYINGEEVVIPRCVERGNDGVVTGTGDLIYVPVNERDFSNYLKWYLSEHIGNMLTIRPTYRWNGSREVDFSVYENLARFLDSMGIYYAHMRDGRELPGCNTNPTFEELDSAHFLGRQSHEFDSHFVYGAPRDITNNISMQMYYDLFIRMNKKYPERMYNRYIAENIHYTPERQCLFASPEALAEIKDMKSAAERVISSLRITRRGNTRHTGTTTTFKYFYQAGYEWVGAELMYSPTELTVAALRGASSVYGGKIGAHNAVQWSTTPHDTEGRYRRYRLALFICYMQGIDEINTEEGLWRLEEYYNYHHRFTPACESHTAQQKDLFKYISTHTRRGRYYTPIAFLHGRYDGWKCFGRSYTWGLGHFGFSDIERSWDLLTSFYPKSVMTGVIRHPCPDEELGHYSGTPSGNVDIIPIEAEDFSKYRLLIAIGYNKAEKEDIEKLQKFVLQGGDLLIGWPQLSVTLDREDAVRGNHTYFDGKSRDFVSDTYDSYSVSVCEDIAYDEVLVYTDSGRPLVTLKHIGEGRLCFVNAKEYAGSDAVSCACRAAIAMLTNDCLAKESIYAKGDRNVQFTVFERENGGRDIYFIATDWHKADPSGVGKLILGQNEYSIAVPWGQLVKVCAYDGVALYPEKEENEVLYLDRSVARVQGVGEAKFILCKDGVIEEIIVDFSDSSVKEIKI